MANSEGPLRWGILSVGEISSDFAVAFHAYLKPAEHTIAGVAARNKDKATNFAKEHKIPKVFGSYEELVKDGGVGKKYATFLQQNSRDCIKIEIKIVYF